MKLFFQFLRSRLAMLIWFFISSSLFCLLFWLYRFPLSAILYPSLLCLLLGIIFLIVDFRRVYRRHKELITLQNEPIALLDAFPMPMSVEEADYQLLISLLREEALTAERNANAGYTDMLDYYTVWAHQIKTPIASMRLHLQSEDSPLSRRLLLDLGRIEQYADMVLTYLRLDSGSTDYVIRNVDLDALIRSAVKRFSGEFILRGLRLDYQRVNCHVLTDEKWLGFVLEQLLSNALKYTPKGTISIYLKAPAALCIQDTGIGIAPEDLPRVFERGYTGYNGRSDHRATGIGLYLCSRICKNLHHHISIESEIGVGTMVTLKLAHDFLEIERL